jgi:hypothetical protein
MAMKNNKGFIVPVLLAIIAVLVVGGGVYVYNDKKSEAPVLPVGEEFQVTDQIQTNTQTESTNGSEPCTNNGSMGTRKCNPSESANWKTYKDEKYGFQFKYPSDWTFQKNDPYGWVVGKYPDYGFYLHVINHPYTLGIESGVTPNKKLSSVDNHKSLIGGTEEYVLTYPPTQDSVYAEIETAPYSSLSYIITLSMDSNNHTKEMRKIFLKILSTFKFTSSQMTTNNTCEVNTHWSEMVKGCVLDQPSITVLSPNGGEVLERDLTQTIKWSSKNYSNGTKVDIRLVRQNDNSPYNTAFVIKNVSINQGSYAWKVGYTYTTLFNPTNNDAILGFPGDGQYIIQICEAVTNNCDSSNAPFTIAQNSSVTSSTQTKVCSNAGISVYVPNQPNYKCDTEAPTVLGNTVTINVGYWNNLSQLQGKQFLTIYKFNSQIEFDENKSSIDYNLINSNYTISGTTGLYYEGKASIGSGNKKILVPSKWIIIIIGPASSTGISQTTLDSIVNSVSF